jgi:ATP-dependent DNA ligase
VLCVTAKSGSRRAIWVILDECISVAFPGHFRSTPKADTVQCLKTLRHRRFIEPCIPTVARVPLVGPAWVHEIKHDGYRRMVWRDGERVRLFTRRGFDWTRRYPWIVYSGRRLPVSRFLIDGEAVVCGEDSVSDFERLHSRQHDARVLLYAFDLLAIDGTDLRRARLDVGEDLLRREAVVATPVPSTQA